MRSTLNTRKKMPNYVNTYTELDGEEVYVKVYFDSSPAEPDVGWPGGFELECVELLDGTEIIEKLEPAELESLSMRVQEMAFPDPYEEY